MIEYEKTPADEFDWPCDRREAHGPHPVDCQILSYGPGIHDHSGSCEPADCPGVLAHPATMIGTVLRPVDVQSIDPSLQRVLDGARRISAAAGVSVNDIRPGHTPGRRIRDDAV